MTVYTMHDLIRQREKEPFPALFLFGVCDPADGSTTTGTRPARRDRTTKATAVLKRAQKSPKSPKSLDSR